MSNSNNEALIEAKMLVGFTREQAEAIVSRQQQYDLAKTAKPIAVDREAMVGELVGQGTMSSAHGEEILNRETRSNGGTND